jgi:glyoxylase-like metal-dependent hydrolase (beta-lactamase superfamily II)
MNIKKVAGGQPIKYMIYSHHHYDHIAGGKPFKDAGATFVAHKRAQERLMQVKDSWSGYENGLPMVLRRYCGLWGRGT